MFNLRPLVRSYKEKNANKIPNVYLPNDAYGEALQCFVPMCTDIVPIDRAQQLIYLASRKAKPMTGLWWIGGRMKPGELKEEAAIRNFKRETQLELTYERFQLAGVFEYIWKDRAQPPQDMGCHMCAFTYTVELSASELRAASANLEKNEYEASFGLQAFSREDLIRNQVFPAILDLYETVFPQSKMQTSIVDSI